MNKQVCTRCVMDNTSDDSITFNEKGECNYCTDALLRMPNEYFPNEYGKKKLDEIMYGIIKEGEGKKYDCMVGVSGGIDSSYIVYLGYQYGLRMLAVHIDDGFDTEIATNNILQLCEKAKVELVNVKPDNEQYRDLTKSFFLANVPNLAMAQDNTLLAALNDISKKYGLKYNLSGANFALECILERSTGINSCDKKHIKEINRLFGTENIDKLRLMSFFERYIKDKYINKTVKILPLNYIDYNLERVLKELSEFCNYNYYGGKHYESILTRFLQCYYLPERYGFDKRKSHFSSMIVSGQMTRNEAIEKLQSTQYISEELKEFDFNFIADYLGMSRIQFDKLLEEKPKEHSDYRRSYLNNYARIARSFRKYLGQ